MKAIILAAGFGTRLKPLTDTTPKALLQVGSLSMLERAIFYLARQGVAEIIVNSHYLAKQVENFVSDNWKRWPVKVKIIFETEILDTGGAIKNAKSFLSDSDPFIVFNVDILTNLDLRKEIIKHNQSGAVATLIVNNRTTNRPLLIDQNGRLAGHLNKSANERILVKGTQDEHLREVGFMGIHIVSTRLFEIFPLENKFSIINFYLKLAEENIINTVEVKDVYWLDVGSRECLQQAENDLRNGLI